MKLLQAPARPGRSEMLVLLFGSGAVGAPIATTLETALAVPGTTLDYDWTDAAARAATRRRLLARLAAGDGSLSLAILFAASPRGMASTADAMAQECALVREIIDLAADASGHCARLQFHLMSSAGGLFEGQTFVDRDTKPAPTRPYGRAKLQQEAWLHDLAARHTNVRFGIHRIASVYGFAARGRLGLVQTLISNGLRRVPTRIFGRQDTVRDYVYNEDIARLVAGRIVDESRDTNEISLLASGKPTSIGEIVREVEAVLGRRVLLQYDPRPDHAEPMSFRPCALPGDLQVTDLRTGIRRVAFRINQQTG